MFCLSNIGTLPAWREAKSLHLFGLFCVPSCALACRGTVRLPLTLSVLRMWMWNHLHTVFVSRPFVLVISPSVHGVPDLGLIVFADCIRWMEAAAEGYTLSSLADTIFAYNGKHIYIYS